MSKTVQLSHVYIITPTPGYWDPIPYISATQGKNGRVFRRGRKGWMLWTAEEVAAIIQCGDVIPVCPNVDLKKNDEVFVLPSGEVVVADSTLVRDDPNLRIVGRLPRSSAPPVPASWWNLPIRIWKKACQYLSRRIKDKG